MMNNDKHQPRVVMDEASNEPVVIEKEEKDYNNDEKALWKVVSINVEDVDHDYVRPWEEVKQQSINAEYDPEITDEYYPDDA